MAYARSIGDGGELELEPVNGGTKRKERQEGEERVPGEGIRSCARDKAERGVEGEDRRRGDAWLGTDVETANDGGRRGTRRT